MTAIDWDKLRRQAEAMDAPLSDIEFAAWRDGLMDGNARMYAVEYVDAIQRAVEGHDRAHLDALLAASIPPPPFVLPLLASAEKQGRRPPAFTAVEDAAIRSAFDVLTHPDGGLAPADVKRTRAKMRHCSVKTISRSLARTESPSVD